MTFILLLATVVFFAAVSFMYHENSDKKLSLHF